MTWREYMRKCEADYIAAMLEKHRGCVREAAREAGVYRTAFYAFMQRHGFDPPRIGKGHRGVWT